MKMGLKLVLALTLMAIINTPAYTEETDAAVIFNKVVETYKAMDTYQSEGIATTEVISPQGNTKLQTVFTIKLKKPNLYQISWRQINQAMPQMSQIGAVWNAGDQPYLFIGAMGVKNEYYKVDKDEMAIAGATGISSGAAYTIPSLFLSFFQNQTPGFLHLTAPKIERLEEIDGRECYVISGSSKVSAKETFWISKDGYLIVKTSQSFARSKEEQQIPEMTEEQVVEAIKMMGQEVTEENKQKLREMMAKREESMANSNLQGSMVEVHKNITTPDFNDEDFEYELPEGTILKESFFDKAFKDN